PGPEAAPATAGQPTAAHLLRPLAQQVAELEQRAIAAALDATGGNKLATARMLGISRATLYDRMGTLDDSGQRLHGR
ncbi:helix-turn-helix domain-containing protein, partial [Delftia tsuruhatensis]